MLTASDTALFEHSAPPIAITTPSRAPNTPARPEHACRRPGWASPTQAKLKQTQTNSKSTQRQKQRITQAFKHKRDAPRRNSIWPAGALHTPFLVLSQMTEAIPELATVLCMA